MARLPRITIPDYPHHVTQRGNRRQKVFLVDDDYAVYRSLLAEQCERHGVAVWSYCLMPNHVHLILVPETAIGFSRAIGETHRRYSGYINARLRATGHLFQGRFGSVAMDEDHLMAAFRYIAQNPVKAKLVERAQDWRWSSTPAHIKSQDDELVTVAPLLERVEDAAAFLQNAPSDKVERALAVGQSIGRPLVSDEALTALEHQLGRALKPRKRGRPKRQAAAGTQGDIFTSE